MTTPTRAAGLDALHGFVPHAGADYHRDRNHDLGSSRTNVSGLSPYIRHRLVTEQEVVDAVLARHNLHTAERFVQEVFWRSYWKGWLEQRPRCGGATAPRCVSCSPPTYRQATRTPSPAAPASTRWTPGSAS